MSADFLARLTEEHRAFEGAALRLLRDAEASGDLAPLFVLCDDFLIGYHDAREEREIHPRIRGLPRLREGGPECTLHFDRFMNDRPLKRAARVCARRGLAGAAPQWCPAAAADIRDGSPLAIPDEDHEATRALLRALADPHGAGDDEVRRRLDVFAELIELRREHHRREDRCFFPMCRDLVGDEVWRELGARDEDWRPPRDRAGAAQAVAALAAAGWTRFAG